MEKENDQPLVYNGRENGWVLFTYPNGDVFRGYFKDNKPFEGFMTCKHSGDVYEYKVENGRHSNEYTIWYSNGDVFRGKKLVEGVNSFVGEMTYFNRYIFKGYFNNGKPFEGLMTYNRIGDVYEYKIENGRRSNEYTVKYNGGIIFKGKLDGYNNPFVGEMTYPNGNVFKGYFKDSEPFDGEMTYAKGDVCIGEWENDKPLNVSVKLKLSDTGKSYCLFRKGKNNSLRDVKYCLEDGFGNVIKAVIINYEKINKMLNKDSSKINSLDDLIESGAIEMVKSFNDLKEFSKEILKDKMSGGIENGFVGCRSSLEGLLLLSSIDTVEQLKKTRFQLYYTKEDENSLKKDYRSLKNFLKSVGIDNIKEVKEDYISLGVATIPVIHAVGVILDIKKMKELMERTGNRDLDGAV
ncbi:MAG: hypothetical protein LBP39_03430, partial [Rickettsiales bacterium]|nr:hypothetical protein [Rickettsiales bacterium]